jgi:kynurenine formamidase
MGMAWLSHVLREDSPAYGGKCDTSIQRIRSLADGDSCNQSLLRLNSHAGTHMDAPRHFVPGGETLDTMPPETFFFEHPQVANRPTGPDELIDTLPPGLDPEADILLLRTGFQAFRTNEIYWRNGPCLAPGFADALLAACPKLRALGLDCLSISGPAHREAGRAAHRAFLGRGVLLFEDMNLEPLQNHAPLQRVVALPLRFDTAEGAPCAIVGQF